MSLNTSEYVEVNRIDVKSVKQLLLWWNYFYFFKNLISKYKPLSLVREETSF